jgi:hypothetical protein
MQQTSIATIKRLREKPTVDQVLKFLKDNRAKSFVLDIETDSTIQADEDREKQRRTEFVSVLGNLIPQLSAMVTAEPKTATFAGEVLKFATAPFRSGRMLDGAIDELVEQMKIAAEQGGANKKKDPITAKSEVDMQIATMNDKRQREKDKMDNNVKLAELKQKDQHKRLELFGKQEDTRIKSRDSAMDNVVKMQESNQKVVAERESHQAHMAENAQKLQLGQQKLVAAQQTQQQRQQDFAARADERRANNQFKMQQAMMPKPARPAR